MADTGKKLLDSGGLSRLWGHVKELFELLKNDLKITSWNTTGLLRIGDKDHREDVANWDGDNVLAFSPILYAYDLRLGTNKEENSVKNVLYGWEKLDKDSLKYVIGDWKRLDKDQQTDNPQIYALTPLNGLLYRIRQLEKRATLLEQGKDTYSYVSKAIKGGNTYRLTPIEGKSYFINREITNIMINTGDNMGKCCMIQKCYQSGEINTVVSGHAELVTLPYSMGSGDCTFTLAADAGNGKIYYPDYLKLYENGKEI